jgi:N-sulfoglucosamine sulfohydrolase
MEGKNMARFYDRRSFVKGAGISTASLALYPWLKAGGNSGELPNILWLVSEDNSPWFGCYGDDFATTPNLDRLAEDGILFENAFANAPVCAPARFTIHTGVYASSAGCEQMRSFNPIPGHIRFFTHYLRDAGYFCINGNKTDYNTAGTPEGAWDGRRLFAPLLGMKRRQPFFIFVNYITTHESSLHKSLPETFHDPGKVKLAPYHPDTPEVRHDYAQYYDKIMQLDKQVGEILDNLEDSGLAESTIVVYFSDHGGILPRSKRFLYDSGLRVPMIIRVPRKYQHLSPWAPGARADRLVSFIDLAPTMLSLAGIKIPDYMQGSAFLGEQVSPGPDYVYGFRGRMDEVYDMSRAVRDRRFKYIRNYYPHFPYGRHIDYLWKMPAMQSWEREYKAGRLNNVQKRFFAPKPTEELYDIQADPYEINNLAENAEYKKTLERMREANRDFLLEIHDAGFLQEAELFIRSEGSTPYQMVRDENRYNLERIVEAAESAGLRDPENIPELIQLLKDKDSGVRYWAAVGCSALEKRAKPAAESLEKALKDSSPSVRIASAEALCKLGRCDEALPVLEESLSHQNIWVGLYSADTLTNIEDITGQVFEKERAKAVKRVRNRTTFNAIR